MAFFWIWFLFRLHEGFMATVFLPLTPFWASWGLYDDYFSASGSLFGFMKASWRLFFCLWFLFRLHESFMATVFLPLVPFFGFMKASWRPFFCLWFLFSAS
ncbi:hypothetical protein ABE26_03660 [Cytobacillus firmus]|nr:hypothetical protein [Cytobacillus firmus]